MTAITDTEGLRRRIIANQQLPTLDRTSGRGPFLPTSRTVLLAIRPSLDAELFGLGFTQQYENPIDVLLGMTAQPDFFLQMVSAIAQAETAAAFAPAREGMVEGARVRLVRRPDPDIGLPAEIVLNTEGTLDSPDEGSLEWGPGWNVTFHNHGLWWTPTDTLELL